MLSRLLRYDLRSMWKQFSILWPAVLVVAVVNRLLIALTDLVELPEQLDAFTGNLDFLFNFVPIMVYFALIVALFVISLIYILQRFYNGLLGSEGYLMHTLPVKTWHLIASKLITATIATLCSGLVGILSILILSAASGPAETLIEVSHDLGTVDLIIFVVQLLIMIIFGIWAAYTQIYAACAFGQLSNKNRLLLSVVAYVAISIILSTLTSMAMIILSLFEINGGFLSNFMGNVVWSVQSGQFSVSGAVHITMLIINLLTLAKSALFFFITEYLLRKKLNLQ